MCSACLDGTPSCTPNDRGVNFASCAGIQSYCVLVSHPPVFNFHKRQFHLQLRHTKRGTLAYRTSQVLGTKEPNITTSCMHVRSETRHKRHCYCSKLFKLESEGGGGKPPRPQSSSTLARNDSMLGLLLQRQAVQQKTRHHRERMKGHIPLGTSTAFRKRRAIFGPCCQSTGAGSHSRNDAPT